MVLFVTSHPDNGNQSITFNTRSFTILLNRTNNIYVNNELGFPFFTQFMSIQTKTY